MGVPMDRGLTHFSFAVLLRQLITIVEMGVPMDRGLTQKCCNFTISSIFTVEMGVPMDRGLTQIKFRSFSIDFYVEMGVPMDRGLTHLRLLHDRSRFDRR